MAHIPLMTDRGCSVAVVLFVSPHGLVEGLVHVSDLADDYYLFEEKAYRLKGQNTGRSYRLRDALRVPVVRVNPNERLLDFVLVERESRRHHDWEICALGSHARQNDSPPRSRDQ